MDSESSPTVLAIDPGSAKCGVAIVSHPPLTVLDRSIVPTHLLITSLGEQLDRFPTVGRLIMGSGTGSRTLSRAIRDKFPELPLLLVDEHGTSQLARVRFIAENPARGWGRLLPAALRTPDRPYDDLVALLIAERYFAEP